ncbi:MAG: hypothetical protein A3I68_03445 [Candidatus Melainabacteria bacterium RIFCSPLOWO2_02_FULL_35_15]|nr:MAG: hypothetical protein A3F80_03765 [Candidatus Melainabacteria bacterium RIFCSPLOWO2_12_FULL_35_11]OGI14657.1 MAG: hypothetical protein A3I68_03445 [Candidatus Melainabacteria bacterium RIFCSPLOWO2_02_FULL_35_15]
MVNFLKILTICFFFILFSLNIVSACDSEENIWDLDIYKVDPSLLDSYEVIEKGTTFNLVLKNNIYTGDYKKDNDVLFDAPAEYGKEFKVSGSITMLSPGSRFSKPSSVGFLANKLYLDDGQEINLSAYSPVFTGVHPPHANTDSIGLARAITSLSIAGSPVTFGASLGISFLASGLLSAYQNGFHDFFWGGLDGTGLSFIERIFRKQPELSLNSGSLIPFTLSEDLKISKGIRVEKLEKINLSNEEALKKIEQLLKWGDLAGALELSIKTGQKEKYEEIMRKISS